jgi:hypothetical protein
VTVADAAAPDKSLSFLFWGAGVFVMPAIAIYTATVYWVFRGKPHIAYAGTPSIDVASCARVPRAQAAHQQASHLARQLKRLLAEREAEPWRYRDFGSLVSLGDYSTVGKLMGGVWVEGLQDARDCAARRPHCLARYSCEHDYAPIRAARETALSALRTGNDGFNDIVRVFDLAKLGVPQGRGGAFFPS